MSKTPLPPLLTLLLAGLASGCAALPGGDDEPASSSSAVATVEADVEAGVEDAEGVIARTGRGASEAVTAARTTAREGLPGAATAPLEDLNITRVEIPQSLVDIAYVYTAYPPPDCDEIADEITRLDLDLGRDYDAEAAPDDTLSERGGEAVGDLVVDTIRGFTTDAIPFRSVVREASGAAAYERRRSRAFAAGYARRAYLKGLALGQGCDAPAAPRIITAPVDVED